MKRFLYAAMAAAILLLPEACDNADYDVYLLIGQSNMAGRGTMQASDTLDVMEGVWLLDPSGRPEPAVSPLNKYSTIRKGIGMQQIGPGNSFSEEMHRATGHKILLVVNARGGSSLEEWMPDNASTGYFDQAVMRAGQAMKYGKLKAILWHQGESNSGMPETYLDSLSVFVDALRRSLDAGGVPFIAGEVGHWTNNAAAFNRMISHISEHIPLSGYVVSDGCSMLKDVSDPHFSREGQMLLGRRYADRVLEMMNPASD